MKENDVVVAYSFGGSEKYGPGETNHCFAQTVASYQRLYVPAIVQDYIADCWELFDDPILVVKDSLEEGKFIGTEGVTDIAYEFIQQKGISRVILVAHPFLHRFKCKRLLEQKGLIVFCAKTGWIPFDKNSDGWWTRGPFQLLLYAFLQQLAGRHGR